MDNRKSDDQTSRDSKKREEDALTKYEDELEARWKEFVHRVRVHEMLKCLQSEHQKLQLLKNNANIEELLIAEDHRQQKEAEQKATKDAEDLFKGKASKAGIRDASPVTYSKSLSRKASTTTMNSSPADRNAEDIHTIEKFRGETQKLRSERKNSAVLKVRTQKTITDEEFEEILNLCDDKMEQQALRDAFDEKKDRDKYLHNAKEQRIMLYDFINSQFFVNFMLVSIIVSIGGIFLMTFEEISISYGYSLQVLDSCIIAIFVVEAILKVTVYRADYFKQVWNLLDMLIIIVYIVEISVDLVTKTLAVSTDITANLPFKFLKSLRALRLIRIIKFLPNLQVVVATVFQSMLSMGSIAVLMILFIFVFAVMGRGLFYEDSPVHFGTIWLAFVTLFQLLTLDDWFELLDPVRPNDEMDEENDKTMQYWIMFGYLFCYIVIEYFVFLNLFVAVLVDNFQLTLADAEVRKKKEALMFVDKGVDIDGTEMETSETSEEFAKFQKRGIDPEKLELNAEDYFPTEKDSRDAELLSNVFKDLNTLDFERFLWKRRLTLLNMVLDLAITAQRNTWTVQDAENVKVKVDEDEEMQ